MQLTNSSVLIEKALRSHAEALYKKIENLPNNASDDYFCSLAYEAKDASDLAEEIARERVSA